MCAGPNQGQISLAAPDLAQQRVEDGLADQGGDAQQTVLLLLLLLLLLLVLPLCLLRAVRVVLDEGPDQLDELVVRLPERSGIKRILTQRDPRCALN